MLQMFPDLIKLLKYVVQWFHISQIFTHHFLEKNIAYFWLYIYINIWMCVRKTGLCGFLWEFYFCLEHFYFFSRFGPFQERKIFRKTFFSEFFQKLEIFLFYIHKKKLCLMGIIFVFLLLTQIILQIMKWSK